MIVIMVLSVLQLVTVTWLRVVSQHIPLIVPYLGGFVFRKLIAILHYIHGNLPGFTIARAINDIRVLAEADVLPVSPE
jgi:hypothetical protein